MKKQSLKKNKTKKETVEPAGKWMLLIEPYLQRVPAGIYYVTIDDYSDAYYINNLAHDKSRFVDAPPLLLELM